MLDLQMGDWLDNIGVQFLIVNGLATIAYLIVYFWSKKKTHSKDFASLLGGMAFVIAFYFSFMNILVPSLEFIKISMR